jgi:hypothetical protein
MRAIFYPEGLEDEPAGSSRDARPPKYRGDKTPAIRRPSPTLVGAFPEKVARHFRFRHFPSSNATLICVLVFFRDVL